MQANQAVRAWLNEVANVRVHATLKERPVDRFTLERSSLRSLPLPYGGRRCYGHWYYPLLTLISHYDLLRVADFRGGGGVS